MRLEERRPPVTPQMAMRVAVLGGIALALFAVIFFRLWFLQVLSGEEYVVQARENRTRELRIPAPRGEIVDRAGRVLVDNRPSNIVKILPQDLPEQTLTSAAEWGQAMTARSKRPKGRRGEPVPLPPVAGETLRRRYERLGQVLGMRPRTIHRRVIESITQQPFAAVTVRADVPRSVMAYLLEHKDRFRGIDIDRGYLRAYPHIELAAHLLGTVGEISPDELKLKRNKGVKPGAVVGKAGLEYTYDRYLRGKDGARILRVDANGRFQSEGDRPLRERRPTPGRNLELSLDLDLQEAGQEAIANVGGGLPGGFVAMNPRNGEVYAMGSFPSFDPSVFAKPISRAKYEQLNSEENGAPLFNRSIAGVYPSASTFKPITSLAGLDAGVITTGTTINDAGCIIVGDQPKCNAGEQPNGPVDLANALKVSSDVYYYEVGMRLFRLGGNRLQKWARALGLGRKSGIDLGDEAAGLIPDQKWRDTINEQERECQKDPKQVGPCYVIDVRPYNLGDNANLAVGQGEVAISPLQMAVAYSAIATGGRVPRPHLGLEIQDATGRLVQRVDPGPARRVDIEPAWRDTVMEGLRRAAQEPGGTSTQVFGDWPHDRLPVFGKTGTAERNGQEDQSWYIAYVPHKTKPIVVAATIERGGFGAERAAPAACEILRSWFDTGATCRPGESQTR